jgi:Cadherin domain/Cadherin-like
MRVVAVIYCFVALADVISTKSRGQHLLLTNASSRLTKSQGVRRHRSAVQYNIDDLTGRGPHTVRSHGGHGSVHTTGQQFEVRYVISEEIPIDSYVGNIMDDTHLADKYSPEILRTLRFRFLNQPTTGNTLSVDSMTGRLTTIGRIDRETLCANGADSTSSTSARNEVCKLRFDVALQPVQFFQIIRVVVEILDVNDHSPQFSAGFRHHELLETALLGSTLASPTATDRDSAPFSVARYRLQGNGDDADFFRLRVDRKPDGSADVRLVLVKPLDRESRDVHQLVIVAYDGGEPPHSGTADVTIVVVDANDNRPTFERSVYEATVSENAAPMTSVVRVVAHDADSGVNGKVKYQLSSASVQAGYGNFLTVDDASGEIYVTGLLDRERTPVCHVTITATDCGIEPLSSEVTVVIRVEDVNDCPPDVVVNTLSTSGSAIATVPEDATPGTFVAHLVVTDRDTGQNGLTDCLMTSQSADTFRLERLYEETEYQLVTTRSLDREQRAEYQLQVVCTDRGLPVSLSNSVILTVSVGDVNDNWPVFSQATYTASLLENNYVGAFIVQTTASDADSGMNAVIKYSLEGVGLDVNNYFDINSTTGTIFAKTSIDYETNKQFRFIVTASDRGSPPKSGSFIGKPANDLITNILKKLTVKNCTSLSQYYSILNKIHWCFSHQHQVIGNC